VLEKARYCGCWVSRCQSLSCLFSFCITDLLQKGVGGLSPSQKPMTAAKPTFEDAQKLIQAIVKPTHWKGRLVRNHTPELPYLGGR
jgi:hypothetical protein